MYLNRHPNSSMSMASSQAPSATQSRHTQLLMQFNEDIFKQNVLTDIECVVEGQIFKAHRALLVCFSPYLKKKLISSDGKPLANKIHIPKIGGNEFKILLRYMYTGSLNVDCNTFFYVYKAASLLEMQDAKQECLQMIDGRDEVRTYFYTYILSKQLGVPQNWQKALKLITHRFEETVLSKEFIRLDVNYVLEILSVQTIGARSETIVFLAALNWLNYAFGIRSVHAVRVMECVRFSSMTMEEIVACYHPPFLQQVVQIPEVLMMLFKATCYIAAKSLGQETWFKQYASPKRNLTVESLPMELWHKRSPPVSSAVAPPDVSGEQKHNGVDERWSTAPELEECLRSAVGAVPNSDDLKNKAVKEKLATKSKRYSDSILAKKKGSDVICLKRPHFDSEVKDSSRFESKNVSTSETGILRRKLSVVKDYDEETEAESDSSSDGVFSDTKIDTYNIKRSKLPATSLSNIKSRARKSYPSKTFSSISSDEVMSEHAKIIPLQQQLPKFTNKLKKAEYETIPKQGAEAVKSGLFGNLIDKVSEERAKTVEVHDLSCLSKENLNETQAKVISLTTPKYPDKDSTMQAKPKTSASIISSLSSVKVSEIDDSKRAKAKTKDDIVQPKDIRTAIRNALSKKSKEEEGSIFVIGGMDPMNTSRGAGEAMSVFHPKTNKWVHYSNVPEVRHSHTAAYLDNFLYVIGGCNPEETIAKNRCIAKRSCFKLDLRNMKWSTLPDMKCSRCDHSSVVYGGHLYVIGGQDENERLLKSVEVFEPRRNRWRILNANMCCGRKAMGVAVYDNRIWVAGGFVQSGNDSHLQAVSHVDCYHPEEKRWYFNIYSLPGPRFFCSLVMWNEKLFCIGGMTRTDDGKTHPTDEVWFVGHENDLWTKGTFLPEPRMGGLAVTCGDNLYYLGGFNPECKLPTRNVLILKPNAASWDEGPSLSSPLLGLSAVVSQGKHV